jgi:hypothetical protein
MRSLISSYLAFSLTTRYWYIEITCWEISSSSSSPSSTQIGASGLIWDWMGGTMRVYLLKFHEKMHDP